MYFARLDDSPMFRTQVSAADLVFWGLGGACPRASLRRAVGSSAFVPPGGG